MSVSTQAKERGKALAIPRFRLQSWRLYAVLAAICALPIAFYAPFFAEPFMRDEGFYAAVAQIIERGGIPYRDAFDNKPPLIFVYYWSSFAMFGEHIWAPRLLAALMVSATTLIVYFQARFIYSQRASLVAMAAFALSNGLAMFETNANVEYFMLLPTMAALLCFTLGEKRGGVGWFFACGVLSGLSVMTKETSAFAFVLFFLFCAWQEYRDLKWGFLRSNVFWRKSLSMSAGFVLALFACYLPFLLTGTSKEYFDAIFVYTFLYVGAGQGALFKLQTMATAPLMLVYATGPFAIFAFFGAWSFLKRQGNYDGKLLAAWFIAGDIGIIAAGRFFAHYYVMLFPVMALLVPAGFVYVRDLWKTRRARLWVWSLIAISLIAPIGINGAIYFRESHDARHEQKYFGIERAQWETRSMGLSDWIDERTNPDDYIYNLGFQSEVHFYTGLRSPTRFMFDYPFQLHHDFEQEALADLKANPPVYIFNSPLDQPPGTPNGNYYPYDIYAFMQEKYEYLGMVYYAHVWHLKGHSPVNAGS